MLPSDLADEGAGCVLPLLPSGEKMPEGKMRGPHSEVVLPLSGCAPPHPALRATFSPLGRRGVRQAHPSRSACHFK